MADFIGQANVIPGRVLSLEGDRLFVSLFDRVFPVRAVRGETFSVADEVSVVVRPENLLPSEEGIPGTVRTATFLGGRVEYEILLPSGRTVLSSDAFLPGRAMHREGVCLHLSFSPVVAVALPGGKG